MTGTVHRRSSGCHCTATIRPADDPADGETCILPAEGVSGRWMLLVLDVDWLFALSKKESDELKGQKLHATAELTWSAIPPAGGTQEQLISLKGAAV